MANENKDKKVKWYKSWIAKQLYLSVGSAMVVTMILFWMLSLITRHNQEIEVPDFTNISVEEVANLARSSHLRAVVADSVYISHQKRGVVVKQIPAAGSKVKKNRRIILTINSLVLRTTTMPNLIGVSLRQAVGNLTQAKLKVGKLIYTEDIATNNVLGQSLKGHAVAAGAKVALEAEIDLILGLNRRDGLTKVPNLQGLTYSMAKSELAYNSLNVAGCVYDRSVVTYADTLQAVVYKQEPLYEAGEAVVKGSGVTIYLKRQ